MSVELDKSKLTQSLLKCISDHLSGRKDCRRVTYRIAIGVKDKNQSATLSDDCIIDYMVAFLPEIKIFPDTYHRKPTDKVSVISHVISEHFPELLYQKNSVLYVDTDRLVKGIYEYQPSFDNKKRRWVRIF